MACPDPETLELLFSGALPATARATIADHAASCDGCRALIDVLLEPGTVGSVADGVPISPLALGFALAVGERVGRYVIERRIGQGAMGVVYAARDPELGRAVAIKLLRAGGSADRLRREAQALARLSHPNAVAVHDVGEHAGQTFIAMALVDGDTLRRWLETPRATAEILRVLVDAGRGLAAAHAAGLVHRDIKPDNLFVARDGAVLVGDFGLARDEVGATAVTALDARDAPTGEPSALTATGAMVGTPAYMAPEQRDGAATAASDQFAFCVTAWEALCGARPFAGATHAALGEAIARGAIAAPPTDRAVPPHVLAALRRGLAADPAARWGSMSALLAAFAPRARARRWRWIAAGTGALCVAGGIGLAVSLARDPQRAAPPPPAAAMALSPIACTTIVPVDLTHLHAPVVRTALIAYGDAWILARVAVCATQASHTAEAIAANVACLDDRRTAHVALAQALDDSANAQIALTAIDRLPPIDTCATAAVAPPLLAPSAAALAARILALETAARIEHEVARDDVAAIIAEADTLRVPALEIRARVLAGSLLHTAWDSDRAEPELRRAIAIAEQSRDDASRVEASLVLVRVLARLQRAPEAHHVLDDATAVIVRLGSPRSLADDALLARVAVLRADADHAGAIEALRGYAPHASDAAAIAAYDELGGELELSGRGPESSEAFEHARALEAKLGLALDTAEGLRTAVEVAESRGDFTHAIELAQRASALDLARAHAPTEEALALANLADTYELAGAWVQLREIRSRELALLPERRAERASVLESLGTAELRLDDYDPAIAHLRSALDLARAIGPGLADTTTASISLGVALVARAKYRDARTLLAPLVPVLAAATPPRPWRLATASDMLARALWEDGDDRDRGRARALAADAERDYARAIDELAKVPVAATSVEILRPRLEALRAWRARHP